LAKALRYHKQGGPEVLQFEEVAVSDTGAGIAPKDKAAGFEEFTRVSNDSARKAEGTGLGLPLAKRFIDLHGMRSGWRVLLARAPTSVCAAKSGASSSIRNGMIHLRGVCI
jgi:light-regulated signal transduction histidine kinase (bacteriophytochrome)